MSARREELLDLLDDVSASLENVLAAHGNQMTPSDRTSRQALVDRARKLCDQELRPEDSEEQDASPLSP